MNLLHKKAPLIFHERGRFFRKDVYKRQTYIKLGQRMSLHSDILPKEYCEELMKLCSDVEPMPFEQVEAVIDASFGYSWKDVFASRCV